MGRFSLSSLSIVLGLYGFSVQSSGFRVKQRTEEPQNISAGGQNFEGMKSLPLCFFLKKSIEFLPSTFDILF